MAPKKMTAVLSLIAAMLAFAIAPATPATDGTHHAHIVHGIIVHVDLEHHSIALHTEHHDLHIHVHHNTRISLNGEPADLADLMPGDRARVRIIEDDRHHGFHWVATHIRARRL